MARGGITRLNYVHLNTNDLCVGIFQAVTEIGGISGGGITRFDCIGILHEGRLLNSQNTAKCKLMWSKTQSENYFYLTGY